MGIRYATREDVKAAMDFKLSSRDNLRIDRAIDSASRLIESMTHRKFYPMSATRYFDWPPANTSKSWRLWLDQDEVLSVSSLSSGGQSISSDDYFLEPANDGPPFDHIEIDLGSSAAFSTGDTSQRAISITGVFGACNTWISAGTGEEALSDGETDFSIRDPQLIGVGDIIKVDDEIMIVTEKSLDDTTVDTSGALSASKGETLIAVTDGSGFAAGQTIVIDAETMLISNVAGNNLIVQRGWDGSTLAAHDSGTNVYSDINLTVTRGALGTTAASHSSTTPTITKLEIPSDVKSLCIAEAVNILQNEQSGYARVVGAGDFAREAKMVALVSLRKQVRDNHGRKARMRSV